MKNNAVVGVLIFVLVLLLGVIVSLLLVINKNSNNNISSINTSNEVSENQINDKVQPKVNNVESVKNTNEPEVREVVKEVVKEVEKKVFAKYDSTANNDGINSDLTDVFIRLGYPYNNAVIKSDGSIVVNYTSDGTNSVSILVADLKGKVVDAIGGPIIDGASSQIFFLMEDGTVEASTTTSERNLTKGIASKGKIEGLNNIVRICYVNNNKGGIPVAIDANGVAHSLTNR